MSDFPFQSKTTRFSVKNALCCARASALAYEDESVAREQTKKWGFEKFKFFDHEGTQAFIAANPEIILVAFRGTEPNKLEDLVTDADLRKTAGPGGKVHSGFLRALNQVMEEVHQTIRDYKQEYTQKLQEGQYPPSLWFTGHSLGAGLATLAVAKLRIENEAFEEPIHGLYTFGSPRVGNKEFSENFNANFKDQTFRVVNNNDVVARVPLRAHGYRHVGQYWYITSDGKLDDDISWWNLALDRVKGRVDDIGKIGTDGLKDHFLEKKYIPGLEAAQ